MAHGAISHAAKNSEITLSMAMSNDFPPFDFTNKNNENIGIDVDILAEITKRTGIKFELKIMSFGSIIAAITTGKVDGAISGMTVTEDRKKSLQSRTTAQTTH